MGPHRRYGVKPIAKHIIPNKPMLGCPDDVPVSLFSCDCEISDHRCLSRGDCEVMKRIKANEKAIMLQEGENQVCAGNAASDMSTAEAKAKKTAKDADQKP